MCVCLAGLVSLWISNDPTKGHQAPESAFSECLVDAARDALAHVIGRHLENIVEPQMTRLLSDSELALDQKIRTLRHSAML